VSESPSGSRAITWNALGIGVATGAYGLSFGAISVASGLTVWQTQTLSLFMFTGASQFALVGVLGAGGGMLVAVATALLLGARNSLYALHLSQLLGFTGVTKFLAAQLTIDESTAMSLRHEGDLAAARRAFWSTGLAVFVLWNIGTAIGALGASFLNDPATLGLDAAIPAGFIALLWPRLRDRQTWAVAGAAMVLALALTPFVPAGIPVLAAAIIPLVIVMRGRRK
jgi:predicted branched-subunit amino acid permease